MTANSLLAGKTPCILLGDLAPGEPSKRGLMAALSDALRKHGCHVNDRMGLIRSDFVLLIEPYSAVDREVVECCRELDKPCYLLQRADEQRTWPSEAIVFRTLGDLCDHLGELAGVSELERCALRLRADVCTADRELVPA